MAIAERRTSQGQLKWVRLCYLRGALGMLKSRHFILLTLFGICTLFYYFGELVNFVGWGALRWEVWYGVHDTQRLLFLAPIIYAGYFFGIKGAVIVTLASVTAFLPRAIIISPFPNPMFRAVFFAIFAGLLGSVIARIRIEFQRRRLDGIRKDIQDGLFTVGDLEVDLSRRLTKRRGQIVKLTLTEYELLSYLVRNSGRVLSHTDLLHHVWGPEYGEESEYLRTFVRQLRRKIEDDPSNPQFIVTEQGFGYRFVEPDQHRQ